MSEGLIYGIAAMVCAALIAFAMTPPVRVLAYKIGAIDIPEDERRMHKVPIPRLGGLAIFAGFTLTTIIFGNISNTLVALWVGGALIVSLGILDDVLRLKAWIKLIAQIGVAFIAVWQNVLIERITLFGGTIEFGNWAIPITVIWIVGLTNAINLIDGLDGLSCGISAICSISLLLVAMLMGDNSMVTVLTAILVGSCLGFLPFNSNPAKIFMGDTGALFLGYALSVLSISGVFKLHAVVSFLIPISIFGLPLFDTAFAIVRRLLHGKSPFSPDRGHLHHRLIDMGLNQKQSVYILYAVCAILGLSAMMFTEERLWRAGVMIIVGFAIFIIDFIVLKNPGTKEQSGIDSMTGLKTPESAPESTENSDENSNENH